MIGITIVGRIAAALLFVTAGVAQAAGPARAAAGQGSPLSAPDVAACLAVVSAWYLLATRLTLAEWVLCVHEKVADRLVQAAPGQQAALAAHRSSVGQGAQHNADS